MTDLATGSIMRGMSGKKENPAKQEAKRAAFAAYIQKITDETGDVGNAIATKAKIAPSTVNRPLTGASGPPKWKTIHLISQKTGVQIPQELRDAYAADSIKVGETNKAGATEMNADKLPLGVLDVLEKMADRWGPGNLITALLDIQNAPKRTKKGA